MELAVNTAFTLVKLTKIIRTHDTCSDSQFCNLSSQSRYKIMKRNVTFSDSAGSYKCTGKTMFFKHHF
jgi:predicted house-cleaning NTP pyrophosphatase (Maf/HAM1 superfamily)